MTGRLRPDDPFLAVIPVIARTVGQSAAAVLAHIAYVEDADRGAQLTAEDLQAATGVSVRTIRRATERLRQQGLITTARASSWNPTLVYRVDRSHPLICPGRTVSAKVSPTRVTKRQSRDGQNGTQSDGQIGTHLLLEVEEQLQEPPLTPQGELPLLSVVPAAPETPDLDAEFSAFWEHYPRKVGKADARKAWTRARRTTDLEPIARGLLAQLPGMAEREKRYVLHPTTWLNGRRWEDEAADVAPPPRSRDPFALTPEALALIEERTQRRRALGSRL